MALLLRNLVNLGAFQTCSGLANSGWNYHGLCCLWLSWVCIQNGTVCTHLPMEAYADGFRLRDLERKRS